MLNKISIHNSLVRAKKKIKIKENIIEQWNDVRRKLITKEIEYNQLDKLLELDFFNRFEDIRKNKYRKMTLSSININSALRMVNGLRDKDGNLYTIGRFMPNKEHKSLNRFNPKDEVFTYLAVSLKREIKNIKDESTYLIETCLRELRALNSQDNNTRYTSGLKFEFDKNLKFLDLTIADSYDDLDEILDEVFNKIDDSLMSNLKNINVEKKVADMYLKLHIKLISNELFKPVLTEEEDQKECEYYPFHALAYYAKEHCGYDGIVYKSTMYNEGKNIVLFNVSDAKPAITEGIRKYKIENNNFSEFK